MRKLMFLIAATAASSLFAGNVCTWTSAKDNKWIEPGNWKGGVVPGVRWDGTGDPGYPTGDTAVFGASPYATIDCTGLYSVGVVQITGSDAPAYEFGNPSDDANLLPIEPAGSITVDASVPVAPKIALIATANAINKEAERAGHPECKPTLFTISNSSETEVVFTRFDNIRLRPGASSTWVDFSLSFEGTGKYEFTGSFGSFCGAVPRLYLRTPGPFEVKCDITNICSIQPNCPCTVNIARDCKVAYSKTINSPGFSIAYNCGIITFNGPGLLELTEHHAGTTWGRQSSFTLNGGTGVRINCPVTCTTAVAGYETPSIHLVTSGGVVEFNSPSNAIPGSVDMGETWAGTVRFPSVQNLGTIRGFSFGAGKDGASVEAMSESDETFLQDLVYTNSCQYTVRNAGTGAFTVASELSGIEPGNGATAVFEAKNGPIVFAPTFSAGAPGKVRFSGTKGVSVPASVEIPDGTVMQLAGGQTLSISGMGDIAWPTLENLSGNNKLAVPAGANLTLDGLTLTAGALDIVTDGPSSRIVVSGMTSGSPVPTGLTKNGQRVVFDDNGRMIQNPTAVDLTVSDKGDQVQNEPTKKVGIVSEGSGANTGLAADETAVKALVQQVPVATTIAVEDGQTLTAEEVAVDYEAGDLTIGETVGTGTLTAGTLRNDSPVSELTVNAALGSGSFTASGIGAKTVKATGAQTVGTLELTGGTTTLSGGTWETADGSLVHLKNGGRLVLEGSLVSTDGFSALKGNGRVKIETKAGGVIRIPAGGVLTNRIDLVAGANAAVYLEGGTFCGSSPNAYVGSGDNPFFLDWCHMYYGVSSGTWTFRKNTSLGSGTHYGVITQRGGALVDEGGGGSFRFGAGSSQMSDWYLSGGSFKGRGLNVGDWGGYNNYTATITVDGEASFTAGGTTQMAYWNSTSTRPNVRSILNLNGGVFAGSSVNRNWSSYSAASRATDKAYVNFNGGTFRSTNGGYMFGNDSASALTHVDRVTVFERGARFDTNGNAPEIATPLEAPTGRGVESIAWNDELTDMIAAPIVKIVGSGEGARAHALLDETTGKVTNIVVTCRGWNYEDGTYAEVCYGQYNGVVVQVPVTLSPNVSGGIGVFGGGTLQLSRTNTYTGVTCVSNATLALNCPDAVNPASKLVLEQGGVLDLRNNAQTFADIETRGGTVKNGLPLANGLVIDFDAVRAGVVRAIDVTKFAYAPDAAVSLLNFNATKLEEDRKYKLATFTDAVSLDLTVASALIPEGWKLRLGTRSLRLVPNSGLMLLVR